MGGPFPSPQTPYPRAVPMVVWWLQNHQTTVPNHVFSPDGVVSRVFVALYHTSTYILMYG